MIELAMGGTIVAATLIGVKCVVDSWRDSNSEEKRRKKILRDFRKAQWPRESRL